MGARWIHTCIPARVWEGNGNAPSITIAKQLLWQYWTCFRAEHHSIQIRIPARVRGGQVCAQTERLFASPEPHENVTQSDPLCSGGDPGVQSEESGMGAKEPVTVSGTTSGST